MSLILKFDRNLQAKQIWCHVVAGNFTTCMWTYTVFNGFSFQNWHLKTFAITTSLTMKLSSIRRRIVEGKGSCPSSHQDTGNVPQSPNKDGRTKVGGNGSLCPQNPTPPPLFMSLLGTCTVPLEGEVLCLLSISKSRLMLIKHHDRHFYYPALWHVKDYLPKKKKKIIYSHFE